MAASPITPAHRFPQKYPQRVFTFRVRQAFSNTAPYESFGCVARTTAEAHRIAERAGWHTRAIADVQPYDGEHRSEKALTHIFLEPGLGGRWSAMAYAISAMGERLDYDKNFGIQLLTEASGREDSAPFMQFWLKLDGSLQVEVGSGRPTSGVAFTSKEMDALNRRFWSAPGSVSPLATKTYLPGFSWYVVAIEVMLVMTEAFGMSEADHFAFYNQSDRPIVDGNLLDQVGDGVFALPDWARRPPGAPSFDLIE